jgi:hypothetical protein
MPNGDLAACPFQHLPSKRDNDSAFFRDVYELIRSNDSESGVVPASESPEATHLTRFQVHDQLPPVAKLIPVNCLLQFCSRVQRF